MLPKPFSKTIIWNTNEREIVSELQFPILQKFLPFPDAIVSINYSQANVERFAPVGRWNVELFHSDRNRHEDDNMYARQPLASILALDLDFVPQSQVIGKVIRAFRHLAYNWSDQKKRKFQLFKKNN